MCADTDTIIEFMKPLRRFIVKRLIAKTVYKKDFSSSMSAVREAAQAYMKQNIPNLPTGTHMLLSISNNDVKFSLIIGTEAKIGTKYNLHNVQARTCLVRLLYASDSDNVGLREVRTQIIPTDDNTKVFSYEMISSAVQDTMHVYLSMIRYVTGEVSYSGSFNLHRELYPAVIRVQQNYISAARYSYTGRYWVNGKSISEMNLAAVKDRFERLPHKLKVFEWSMMGL